MARCTCCGSGSFSTASVTEGCAASSPFVFFPLGPPVLVDMAAAATAGEVALEAMRASDFAQCNV